MNYTKRKIISHLSLQPVNGNDTFVNPKFQIPSNHPPQKMKTKNERIKTIKKNWLESTRKKDQTRCFHDSELNGMQIEMTV